MNIQEAVQILELKEFESIEDLKKCFRLKAHIYHPDKNQDPQAALVFHDILVAYEFALHHPAELCRHFGLSEPTVEEITDKININHLDDIFEDIFGFAKSGRILGYQEPQVLILTIDEFALGAHKKQKLVAYQQCAECSGQGARSGTIAKICTYCFGNGTVPGTQLQHKIKVCPRCRGRGRKINQACERCAGFGRLRCYHRQEFTLPLGLLPFQRCTLDSFDLETQTETQILIEPRLRSKGIFQIDNYDLLCEYQIDFSKRPLPAQIQVKTPFTEVELGVSSTVKVGDVITVSQAGLYKNALKKERGDLRVRFINSKKSFWQKLWGGWFEK